MRCSRLIMIFGMLFCFSSLLLGYENFVLKTVVNSRMERDAALDTAMDAAAQRLKNCIYEENAVKTAEAVFEYTFAALTDTENYEIKSISVSVNGREISDTSELTDVRKGDEIMLCIETGPFKITVPGRTFSYDRTLVRTVTLD